MAISAGAAPLLELRSVQKSFTLGRSWRGGGQRIVAVDGVSLVVGSNEVLALVGESGCGKTTLGRMIVRLLEPSGGQILYEGVDVRALSRRAVPQMHRSIQMIFQDASSSLNPRKHVGAILSTPLVIHKLATRRTAMQRARELLTEVGLPADAVDRWPSQLSGGQQQRIAIARALAVQPRLVVADEPVSALDVSVQAQIVALLKNLQAHLHMSLIFISHDLALVRYIADRVAVMYLGRIVELAPQSQLYAQPAHPYTKALLSAVPRQRPGQRGQRILLRGEVGSSSHIPSGCRFHPRCWKAGDICDNVDPPLREITPGRFVACHFPEEGDRHIAVNSSSAVAAPILSLATGPANHPAASA